MNLLFLTEYQVVNNQGGVERVTQVLSDFFKQKKINVFNVFIKCHNNKLADNEFHFSNSKIKSIENIQFLRKIISENNISIVINQMGFNVDIIKLLRKINSDITIVSYLHSSLTYEATFNELLLSKGLILNKSLIYNLKVLFKPIYLYILRIKLKINLIFIYKHSNNVILLSDKFTSNFMHITGINNPKKLVFIPNPINPNFQFNIDSLNNKEKTILFVGRLQHGKRVDLILNVWQKLYFEFPDWDLKIIGDGPKFSEIKSLEKKLKLQNVNILGNSSKVETHYSKASIFLSLSAFEGFPMVLTEAATFGVVPVVYNTFESVTDLIINDETGFIVPNLNEEILLSKLRILMTDDILRYNMATKGYNYIRKFKLDKIWVEWELLFKNLYIH